MKSSLEKTAGLGRKLKIEVPAEKVSSAFNKIYKDIQKNATLKGFRKGKAPLEKIKSIYGGQVKSDVVQDLISETYADAVTEHKLVPISQPNVHFDAIDEDSHFHYTAEFEVRPDINLKKFEHLKVSREALESDETRINNILERLQKSKAELVPLLEDRPAQKGDTADIDFVGTINGVPLEGGSAQNYALELGSDSFIPGFEDGLVGMKVGEKKTIDLKFPEDYGNAEIAGKPVSFAVTLNKLQKSRLPELNDEFAKGLGEYADLAALKQAVRNDIEEEEKKRINEEFKTRLLKELVKENPVEVPDRLKEQQKAALIQDVEKRLQNQGMNEADITEYKSKWAGDIDETASFMIQSSFLIDALAEKWNLNATRDEVADRMKRYAQQTGLDLKKIYEFYGQSGRLSQLEYQITEEKVVSKLTDLADVAEVPKDKLS